MSNIENLELILDISERLRNFAAATLANLRQAELTATDSQQLKAAIALVRKHAGLHLNIQDLNLTNQCLDLVEQRAAV